MADAGPFGGGERVPPRLQAIVLGDGSCSSPNPSDSWLDPITDARVQIALAIQDSPGLRNYPAEQLAACYQRARRSAARQTGLAPADFPESCPFPLDRILDDDGLPE